MLFVQKQKKTGTPSRWPWPSMTSQHPSGGYLESCMESADCEMGGVEKLKLFYHINFESTSGYSFFIAILKAFYSYFSSFIGILVESCEEL